MFMWILLYQENQFQLKIQNIDVTNTPFQLSSFKLVSDMLIFRFAGGVVLCVKSDAAIKEMDTFNLS
jgi:hypothetical protein